MEIFKCQQSDTNSNWKMVAVLGVMPPNFPSCTTTRVFWVGFALSLCHFAAFTHAHV